MPELGKSGSVGATGGQLPVATRPERDQAEAGRNRSAVGSARHQVYKTVDYDSYVHNIDDKLEASAVKISGNRMD